MMIRRQHVSAAALALVGSWGMTTSQANVELTARVELLEAQIGSIEAYLGQQAKSAEALESALGKAEEAGFSSGINPESRHILLDAWRAQAKAAVSNVPGQKQKAEDVDPRSNRRRATQK